MEIRMIGYSKIKEFIFLMILVLLVFDLIQSRIIWEYFKTSLTVQIYLLIHLSAVLALIIWLVQSFRKRKGVIYWFFSQFRGARVPKGAKIAVLIVVIGNVVSIGIGKPSYPFYDVGMFRWSTNFYNPDKIVYQPKYYYYDEKEVKILDLRKEGFYFLADHWGWGYTHEFTFAATYHNKSQKENFDFLLNEANKLGIDSLWVGVHAVNYETKQVWFDPDPCKAIKTNSNEIIHYGPIYIPDYQLKKCNVFAK